MAGRRDERQRNQRTARVDFCRVAAVKQWRYHPIISRGEPQEASTIVDIPFKLPK
jgi:hypothetical protein